MKRPGSGSGAAADCVRLNRRVIVGAAFAVASGLPRPAAASEAPESLDVQPGDRIQFIKGKLKGEFVRPEMLEIDATPEQAFPFDTAAEVLRRKNRLNRLNVLRLDPAVMDEVTRAVSAGGVLVYSAICTHRGCTVESWLPEAREMRCHCHLSRFDATAAGAVRNGPALRQLAMVPLALDAEGFVVATSGFTGVVGAAKT